MRTFLKHSEEAEEDEELYEIVRVLYDYCLALGPSLNAHDAAEYLKLADELLPAWSVQFPLALRFAPSSAMLTGAVLEATPEPPSVQAKVTATGWFVHPPETNGPPFTVAIAFRIGGFLSTLISPMGPATVQFWERSHT